jgi:hypothetical protein
LGSCVGAGLLALGLAVAVTGCGTLGGPASGSDSFASVTIENHSLEEIAKATAEVFAADGYRGAISGASQMVFEKVASKGTSIARDGLVNTAYGAQSIQRVKVDFIFQSATSFRVQCKAFMVSGGSDPFFQDEVPLANLRSGPYQSLLNKVKKQLK